MPLFNGKDLSGWKLLGNTDHTWKVVPGGILEGAGSTGGSTLATERKDFANFHLRVETKLAEGLNSAIAFRLVESNGESARYLAYIAGTVDEVGKTGSLRFTMRGVPSTHTLALTLAEADPVVPIKPGEWFTEEVIVDGDVITAIVRGIEVAKFKILDRKLTSGAIGLSCRGNSRVVFRKIEIKKLDGAGVSGSPASDVESEKVPDLVNWTRMAAILGNGWRIVGNELVQTTHRQLACLAFGDPTWTDYSFSADVKLVQDTSAVGLMFRHGGKGNYWYDAAGIANNSPEQGSICRWIDGEFTVLPTRRTRDAILTPGRWHRMRVDVKGEEFVAYLDGQLAFAASDASMARGRVGFRVMDACRFRNVRVAAPNGKIMWEGLPEMVTASSFGVSLRTGNR